MEFHYQQFECARCKEFKNTLISIIFFINQSITKLCLDCFAPLLLEANEETIEDLFEFMDTEVLETIDNELFKYMDEENGL